jgi:hypothetical protein
MITYINEWIRGLQREHKKHQIWFLNHIWSLLRLVLPGIMIMKIATLWDKRGLIGESLRGEKLQF